MARMNKVTITLEDKVTTTEGAWLRINIQFEKPFNQVEVSTNGLLDPKKCSVAEFLANEIGHFIQSRTTHKALDGGKK